MSYVKKSPTLINFYENLLSIAGNGVTVVLKKTLTQNSEFLGKYNKNDINY